MQPSMSHEMELTRQIVHDSTPQHLKTSTTTAATATASTTTARPTTAANKQANSQTNKGESVARRL